MTFYVRLVTLEGAANFEARIVETDVFHLP